MDDEAASDRLELAVDVLEYARNDHLQDRAFTPGRQIAELTVIGLFFKVLVGLESVLTLVEKGLPTFAIVREMVEALINMRHIVAGDSVARADLYRDYLAVSRWKAAEERAQNPLLKEKVSSADLQDLEEAKRQVAAKRGEQTVMDMQDPRKWRTWAGNVSVRKMARDAGLSDVVYSLGYSWPSQAVHALDADRYFTVSDDGVVRNSLPPRPESAVLPAASVVLVALEVTENFLNLGKMENVRAFKKRFDSFTEPPRGKK